MKKRLLIVAVILALCFIGVKIISSDKKTEIIADNGKKYFVSCEYAPGWLSDDVYEVNLYDERKKYLHSFSIYRDIPIKTEIKYDGTIDNKSFYRMRILKKDREYDEEIKYEERLWYEFEGDFYGGGKVDTYIIVRDKAGLGSFSQMFDFMKEYALKKILDGEYEWLYSYGETFIEEGHTDFIELIENIVETRSYSPKYLDDDKFYSACEELLLKYR